jgi:NADH-quinone oxidoreductase subunit A
LLIQYLHVLMFAVLGLGFGVALLFVSSLVRARNAPAARDLTPYECGMDAVGPAWTSPNIRFYIFALLFVVFDVEAIFVFPWAVQFKALGRLGFIEVMAFVGVLFVGLVYAWKKDALKWE